MSNLQDDYVPMTDPLAVHGLGSGVEHAKLNESQTESHAEQDTDHEKITRGMPKKGILQFGLIIFAIVALAFFFIPRGEKQKVVVEEKAPTPEVAASVIKELSADAEEKSRKERSEVKENSGKSPVSSALNFNDGRPVLTPLELAAARRESIIASSMDATEVFINIKTPVGGRTGSSQLSTSDAGAAMKESLRQQDEMIRNAMRPQQGPEANKKTDPNQDFLNNAAKNQIEGYDVIKNAPPSFSLSEGTIISAATVSAINTELPGSVTARVTSDVYDSTTLRTLLIPRGSKINLIYKSSILVGQSRVLLAGGRLILPNGKSINLLGAAAADMQGMSGIPADIDNHFYEMFKASMIVGAASLLLPSDQQQVSLASTATGTQTGGSIVGTALHDVLTQVTKRNMTIGPTGAVPAAQPFSLVISRDVAMEQYQWTR